MMLRTCTSILVLWVCVLSQTTLAKVEAEDQTRDEQCPSNYVAASQSGNYIVYFGNSGSEDCCARNELAQACGLNVFCADLNSPVNASSPTPANISDGKNAFTTYSNCETSQEILLGYDGQDSSTNCDDAITFLFDASEQYGCEANEFKLARRIALNECGSKSYLCMVKKAGGVCGETTNLTVSSDNPSTSGEGECPASYTDAKTSTMTPIYLGRADQDGKNVSCCDKYSLEEKCGIDVLCANPAVYNETYGSLFTFTSCKTNTTVLVGLDAESSSLSCDDAVEFASTIAKKSGCGSDAFKTANAQAIASCGYTSYQCLANTYDGICTVGSNQDDGARFQCVAAAESAQQAAEQKGCNSQEYFASLSSCKSLCQDDASKVLDVTVGTSCPTDCASALKNLRSTASVFYTSCGTSEYIQASEIVVALCGPDTYVKVNAEICKPKVDTCGDALANAATSSKYGCDSKQWSQAISNARSVCSQEKVAAAMANARVECPISCDQAINEVIVSAKWPGCNTVAYTNAEKVAIGMCGYWRFHVAKTIFGWCKAPVPPAPPPPNPPPQRPSCQSVTAKAISEAKAEGCTSQAFATSSAIAQVTCKADGTVDVSVSTSANAEAQAALQQQIAACGSPKPNGGQACVDALTALIIASKAGCTSSSYNKAYEIAKGVCGVSFNTLVSGLKVCQSPPPPSSLCSTNINPNGPSNVKVTQVGSTTANICWDVPSNGGCVDYYEVFVAPLASKLASSFFGSIKVQSGQCLYLTHLAPGTEYSVSVVSNTAKYGKGGSTDSKFKTIAATPPPPVPPPTPPQPPKEICFTFIKPDGASDVRATTIGTTNAQVCWNPPGNKGCVDYYDVVVNPVNTAAALATSLSNLIKVQGAQCATITGLISGSQYQVTVVSYTDTYGEGGSTSITLTTVGSPPANTTLPDGKVIAPSPSPSPNPLLPPSPEPEPSPSPIPLPSPSPEPVPSPSPDVQPLISSPSPEPSPIPLPSPSPEPEPSPSPIPLPSPSPEPVPSPSPDVQPLISSPSPEPSPIPLPSPSPEPVPSPSPDVQPLISSPSPLPLPSPSPSPSPLPLPIPSPSPSPLPLPIPSPSPSPLPLPIPSPSPVAPVCTVPGSPTGLLVQKVDESSATVCWSAPLSSPECVDYYMVEISSGSTSQESGPCTTFTGLDPGMQYSVQVTSVSNTAGPSVPASISFSTLAAVQTSTSTFSDPSFSQPDPFAMAP